MGDAQFVEDSLEKDRTEFTHSLNKFTGKFI
jgi:hypothetical protein